MKCNCNYRNGQDVLDFLTSIPGGTAANASYMLGLTHNNCCGRNILAADTIHPVSAVLTAIPVGTPIDVGNGAYCQECLISGTVEYKPCNSCHPERDYVTKQICLPCSSDTTPTITIGTVEASPVPVTVYRNSNCGCCQETLPCTKQIAITTSINVTTA